MEDANPSRLVKYRYTGFLYADSRYGASTLARDTDLLRAVYSEYGESIMYPRRTPTGATYTWTRTSSTSPLSTLLSRDGSALTYGSE